MGKDQKYSQPAEYDPDHKATKHYEKHVMNHIAKHEKSGKYKVNHSFGNGEHQGKKHANPDITMHYSGDAEGNYDAHSYTVHHKGAAANDKKLHAKPMHNFKESVDEVTDYPEVRKHLKKTGKGGSVSYTDNDGKTKKTGKFGGLMNRGGRSYAKVHHDKGMGLVPLPNIHHK